MIEKWEYSKDDGLISSADDKSDVLLINEYSYHKTEAEFHRIGLLAASAPDLLSALQKLLEIYDDNSGKVWTTSSKRRALNNAREAINKALGETK